jgi:hypothetical protein
MGINGLKRYKVTRLQSYKIARFGDMKPLDQLLAALGDLGPTVSVSNHAGSVSFTSRVGMQVVAAPEPGGQVSVTYEEALHVPLREKCSPAAGARLIRRVLERKCLERLEVEE